MQSRSTSNTLLIILMLILTAPVWLTVGGIMLGILGGIFGAVFGIIGGVFGAIFGVIGGIFGALMSVITFPFRFLFDWPDWHWGYHFPGRWIMILFFVLLIVVVSRRQRTRSN